MHRVPVHPSNIQDMELEACGKSKHSNDMHPKSGGCSDVSEHCNKVNVSGVNDSLVILMMISFKTRDKLDKLSTLFR